MIAIGKGGSKEWLIGMDLTKVLSEKKLPSDTTLSNMSKAELIKLLHIAEDNHKVLAEFYTNAVNYNKKINSCNIDKIVEELEKNRL